MCQSLNQDWLKNRTLFLPEKNHPTPLVSHVFRRSSPPASSLILSLPISVKDHEVWHLQEEGQERCFPLARFPCSRLSAMVMPRAKCCLNPFQSSFSIPCNFRVGSATAAVMKRAPLLWSVLLSSTICNKAPFFFFFFPGFVSSFHSHQQVLFRTFLRCVSEGLLMEMRSFATGSV